MNLNKTMVGLLVLSMTCMAMASGCSEKVNNVLDEVAQTETWQESGNATGGVNSGSLGGIQQTPYEGTVVRSGESYNMGSKMAFLSSDVSATSETESSVTLTATVTPVDAPQEVSWSVEFVNAESEWATGKTVTDYVTITPSYDGSTVATVTCKQAFGEQIKIVCTSRNNIKIKAECVVDFMRAITDVSLTFGDDFPINLGGATPVQWCINPDEKAIGGEANLDYGYDEGDVYTIDEVQSWDIDLLSPCYSEGKITYTTSIPSADLSYWEWADEPIVPVFNEEMSADRNEAVYNRGNFTERFNTARVVQSNGVSSINQSIWMSELEDITSLSFDYNMLATTKMTGLGYTVQSYRNGVNSIEYFVYSPIQISTMSFESIQSYLFAESWTGNYTAMYTLRLRLGTQTGAQEFYSLLALERFVNTSTVAGIELSSSSMVF